MEYDANGNLTFEERARDPEEPITPTRSYAHDGWNRLVSVDEGAVTHEYDALGRRVVDDAGTARGLYYSDQWQVIEERNAATSGVLAQQVWSIGYVDGLVLRDADGNAGNGLEERLYVQQDANFNVTALTNTSGTVVERYLYDPYGGVTVIDADWTSDDNGVSDVGWQYLHQGLRFDPATGLYDNRRRPYDPVLGRFLTQDPNPAGVYADGMNLYQYVQSSPMTRRDPRGWIQSVESGRRRGRPLDR